jgi:hypothetical protein
MLDLVFALREATDGAVSARSGAALVAIEADEVRQRARAGPPPLNATLHAGPKLPHRSSKSLQPRTKIGFVLRDSNDLNCKFDLILALHEATDGAVSARSGPALVAVEADEVGQNTPDRFRCARRLFGRHRRQWIDRTFWLYLA